LEYLFEQPIVTVRMVEKRVGCSFATANKLVDQFQRLGLLKRASPSALRNRRFRYAPYLALFEEAQTAGGG
jgi:predicted transcriptional regulator